MTQATKSIHENLRFLCVEIDSQTANLQSYFYSPASAIAQNIIERGGYAYNLKMRVHKSCLIALGEIKEDDSKRQYFRSVEFIATNLERIAELCRDNIKRIGYLNNTKHLEAETFIEMLERVRQGIKLIEPALQSNDTHLAIKIGQLEAKLDRDYQKTQLRYITALKLKKHTEDLITSLFIAHNIEQMGDILLEIGEAIISANLGQALNLERYHALQASVEQLNKENNLRRVHVKPIAETRSGSMISGISTSESREAGYSAIFKEGIKRKVKEERQGVNSWHEIYPGLAPRILSYKKRGRSASLLIEHLPGYTFEQILLNESPDLLNETLKQLGRTLRSVWRETYTDQPVSANFINQLSKRLGEVYKIHPEFKKGDIHICGQSVPSFDALVSQAQVYEQELSAPFSVYIHGDFNIDNIIYDPNEKRINFIDLHRSRYMDYVQDVSVFMVSNYRLQILDEPLRQRIMKLTKDFYRIARRYAKKVNDHTFEQRLALGLARSFATSTRFILDKSLAQNMFLRAHYLLSLVLTEGSKRDQNFKVPIKEIFVG